MGNRAPAAFRGGANGWPVSYLSAEGGFTTRLVGGCTTRQPGLEKGRCRTKRVGRRPSQRAPPHACRIDERGPAMAIPETASQPNPRAVCPTGAAPTPRYGGLASVADGYQPAQPRDRADTT